MRLSFDKHPLCELQTNLFEVNMTKFCNQTKYCLELVNSAVIQMRCMEPQAFDAILGILDYIVTDLPEYFSLGKVKTTQINFQHLYVLAWSKSSSYVTEKIVKHSLLAEMTITEAF